VGLARLFAAGRFGAAALAFFDTCLSALVARTFFFDTFFRLVFLVDFTVFFFADLTFDLREAFDWRFAADGFFATFLPFFRLLLFLAAALFPGITSLQDD
jgi:hypothetical protein